MMNLLFVYVILVLVHSIRGEFKGRYTRDVNNYEVVVPQKVSEAGEFISYYLPHFYNDARIKRSTDKVQYIVPIEGSNRLLELEPTEDFHSPGLLIEHHDKDARQSPGSVKFRRPRKLNCYYHGRVKDEPSSAAAISACSGLAGEITIGNNHYMIEPVKDDDTPTLGPEHKHLVYKREHQKGTHNRSFCGSTDTFAKAFKQRMLWEDKYGEQTEKASMGDTDYQTITYRNARSKKWCTTCKPKIHPKCQSPHPACPKERPLFLELAIVIGPRAAADKPISQDTEQYINTVINIAAQHFQDSSLERPILIKLVRVITMGYIYEDLDPYRYEPKDLLDRFCQWQTHFNPPREIHPNHHDFVLYLVKFSECSGLTQGLTNMASICRPDKACGVVDLEGLLTGHMITHMLGHSMGADHDEENVSGCLPEEPDGTCYHMAQHICTRSTTWSICSRQCISKFTKTHAAWCMSDVPTAHDLTDPTLLPGQIYSAAEQCRMNFEIDANACLVGEFCKHLFCKIGEDECASTGEPPAQGTRCGPDQWCFNQKCVHRGSRPGATNGEWGIWSQWTPCTKTCGGGLQTANRACDSPPPSNGGRKCPGSWIKHRMCNVRPCQDAGKGFLDQQCKNTNNKPYRGRKHEWLYFNQQIEDLHCVVLCINEKNEVAVRAPLAIDGTLCKPGAKDVCIRGQCHPVGCDWVIGSKSKEDACGICHGNGTECRLIQGHMTEQNFQGRMPFLKLPIGTSMILMRETRPSPCFLVISHSLNSTYYLNNDESDERDLFTGVFMIQYTSGIYQLKANMERIFIKDSLEVPITVSLVCPKIEQSIGVLYQYALPEVNSPNVKSHYTWEFLSWEKCPQACGGAVQRAVPVCVEAHGGEVEDSYCPQESRPADRIRVCNQRPCTAKWWVGPWSECDCYMKEGIKTRMVMCAHLKAARSAYITIEKEEECLGEEKPFSEKPCDERAESIFWEKKGERKKRDYMELVPYSKQHENFSVWDTLDDSLIPVNVRELLQQIDPENVEDQVFLRQTGLSPAIWDKIQEETPKLNGHVRQRKSIIAIKGIKLTAPKAKPTPEHALKPETNPRKDKQEIINEQRKLRAESKKRTQNKHTEQHRKSKEQPTKQPPKSTSRAASDKHKSGSFLKKNGTIDSPQEKSLKKKSKHREKLETIKEPLKNKNHEHVKHHKLSKVTVGNDTANSTQENGNMEMEDSHQQLDKKPMGFELSVIPNTEAVDFEEATDESTHISSASYTTQTRGKNRIVADIEEMEETKKMSTNNINQPHTEEMDGDAVNKKYKVIVDDSLINNETTAAPMTVAIRQKTKAMAVRDEATVPATQDKIFKSQPPSTITVPEVKIAPGLTRHFMYNTEKPARGGKCWKAEIKNPPKPGTCRPQESAVLEPAEDEPMWDVLNTSDVKIFVVPIHTTIRAIVQNDDEFVRMESPAKYPVGDELSIIELTGDAARRKFKIAARKPTSKTTMQD